MCSLIPRLSLHADGLGMRLDIASSSCLFNIQWAYVINTLYIANCYISQIGGMLCTLIEFPVQQTLRKINLFIICISQKLHSLATSECILCDSDIILLCGSNMQFGSKLHTPQIWMSSLLVATDIISHIQRRSNRCPMWVHTSECHGAPILGRLLSFTDNHMMPDGKNP